MLRAKWLVLVGLLITSQGYGSDPFMKGVSWHGEGPKIEQMQELGANSVHFNLAWEIVEPQILDAFLTFENRINLVAGQSIPRVQ